MHYVIPQAALCGHLITKSTRGNKILGFPVRIENEQKYARNAFIFNLCFIFERDAELSCFEPVVRKTARILRAMEVSPFVLPPHTSSPNPSNVRSRLLCAHRNLPPSSLPRQQHSRWRIWSNKFTSTSPPTPRPLSLSRTRISI